jgi:hypothetical protein
VEEALGGVPEKAEKVIGVDNKVQRVEEGEEVEDGAVEGAGPVRGEELVRFDWTANQQDEERRGASGERMAPGKQEGKQGKGGGGVDSAEIGVRTVENLVRPSTQSSDGRKGGGGPAGNGMGKPAALSDWG